MNSEVAIVGEKEIDFQTLQEIYNDLTGKTETQNLNLDYAFTIRLADLEQLNSVISQCAVSSGAVLNNNSVTVFHSNKSKDVYSSFDRFKLYNFGNTSPIENILIEYHFLIKNKTSGKSSGYKISIHTTSTIALEQDGNIAGLPPATFRKMFEIPPIRCKVSFVDYVVGRSFIQAIKEWADGLDRKETSKFVTKMQNVSHFSRPILATLTSSIFLLFVYFSASQNPPKAETFPSLIALIACISLVFWQAGRFIGLALERNIDKINHFSILLINKGDERCFEKRNSNNKSAYIRTSLGFLTGICVNLLSTVIAAQLFP